MKSLSSPKLTINLTSQKQPGMKPPDQEQQGTTKTEYLKQFNSDQLSPNVKNCVGNVLRVYKCFFFCITYTRLWLN